MEKKRAPASAQPPVQNHGLLFPLVLLLNAAAVLVGLWFYSSQIASSSPLLWLFIPDCPLYVFLCIFLLLGKIKNETLRLVISAGTLKYGIWTVLVLFLYGNYYFPPAEILMYSTFVLGHLGMAAQGFLLLPKNAGKSALLLLLAWFLLNDFADYALNAHPPLPQSAISTVATFTVALSLTIVLLLPMLSKVAHTRQIAALRAVLF